MSDSHEDRNAPTPSASAAAEAESEEQTDSTMQLDASEVLARAAAADAKSAREEAAAAKRRADARRAQTQTSPIATGTPDLPGDDAHSRATMPFQAVSGDGEESTMQLQTSDILESVTAETTRDARIEQAAQRTSAPPAAPADSHPPEDSAPAEDAFDDFPNPTAYDDAQTSKVDPETAASFDALGDFPDPTEESVPAASFTQETMQGDAAAQDAYTTDTQPVAAQADMASSSVEVFDPTPTGEHAFGFESPDDTQDEILPDPEANTEHSLGRHELNSLLDEVERDLAQDPPSDEETADAPPELLSLLVQRWDVVPGACWRLPSHGEHIEAHEVWCHDDETVDFMAWGSQDPGSIGMAWCRPHPDVHDPSFDTWLGAALSLIGPYLRGAEAHPDARLVVQLRAGSPGAAITHAATLMQALADRDILLEREWIWWPRAGECEHLLVFARRALRDTSLSRGEGVLRFASEPPTGLETHIEGPVGACTMLQEIIGRLTDPHHTLIDLGGSAGHLALAAEWTGRHSVTVARHTHEAAVVLQGFAQRFGRIPERVE